MAGAQAAVNIIWTPTGGVPTILGAATETSTCFIETKAIDVGDEEMSYFIDRVISNISDRPDQLNLVLEIWGSDDEEGVETFEEDVRPGNFELLDTISLAKHDPGYTDPPGKRFYKFIFRDNGIIERWRLHGFTVYGEPGGDEF